MFKKNSHFFFAVDSTFQNDLNRSIRGYFDALHQTSHNRIIILSKTISTILLDAFLDKNIPFELEYGVKGMVTERKKKFRDTYIKFNIIAACVCIFSPIPLIISGFTENELLVIMMLAVMMIVAGIGASIFIVVGVQNASMQKLLKEGEFTEKEKKRTSVKEAVGFAYWGVLTAIFFIWGFLGNDGSGIQGNSWISWRYNWIVFAVGGILFPIVMMLCNLIADKDKKD